VTEPDAGLSGYVQELFAPEDAVLQELRAESARCGLPEISVSAEVGRLLQLLLTTIQARTVLEIGTLGGYSGIWMARSLPADGRLLTLEIDPERAEVARTFIERAGLGAVVEVRVGDAIDILPGIAAAGDRFDAVFIDADKERYPDYLEHALTLVRPGGLILADNAFWSGRVLDEDDADEGTRAVQRFNRRLAEHPGLVATIIPIRDGLAAAVVR
jgi:caffeoyl-CoA O-methyltransferase